mgnify:CR=1 FL=1
MPAGSRASARLSDSVVGIAILAITGMQLMSTLDGTIAIVALPRMQADLDLSDASKSWIITGYALTFGGLLLLGGRGLCGGEDGGHHDDAGTGEGARGEADEGRFDGRAHPPELHVAEDVRHPLGAQVELDAALVLLGLGRHVIRLQWLRRTRWKGGSRGGGVGEEAPAQASARCPRKTCRSARSSCAAAA